MSVEPSAQEPDSDARWLAALAGRVDPDAAPNDDAVREATMLRTAMRRWPTAVDAVDQDDPERIARLLERACIEGLAGTPDLARSRSLGERPRDAWRWWRFGPLPALTAMATVVVVLFVGLLRPSTPGDGAATEATVRGAADAVTLLAATDPEALRGEIADALARQGVTTARYQRFGRFGIDADLPQPPSPALRALLDRYRIPVPADGVLRVEIELRRP